MRGTLLKSSAFRVRRGFSIFAAFWLVTGAACADSGPKQAMVLGGVTVQAEILQRGRTVFLQNCARCHGMKGDGRTTAMRGPHPPPDLRLGAYKYHSVVQGGLPLHGDLLETTRKGLGGDRMPAYDFLSDSDLNAVVQFTKSLSPRWTREPEGRPVAIAPDPWAPDQRSEAVERGDFLYHVTARCWTCHPAYSEPRDAAPLRFDPSKPVPMITTSGLITPPDLRNSDLALGCDIERQVRSVAVGITLSGMPGWHEIMTSKDLWAIGHYLQSLCAGQHL